MTIYEKLREVQVRLHAGKDRKNSFGNYSYRNVEDVLESAKPLLDEVGLTLVITDDVVQVGDRIYVKATSTVFDADGSSVSSVGWAREAGEKKGTDESQRTGMASSYSRKYSIGGLFLLDDGDDADAHDNSSTGLSGGSTVPSVASLGALFQAKGIPGDDVRDKVRDLGYTGLSKVDSVGDLEVLRVWGESWGSK